MSTVLCSNNERAVTPGGPSNLGSDTVYYDMDGSYWVATESKTLNSVTAGQLMDFVNAYHTIQQLETLIKPFEVIRIDLSKKIYTKWDTNNYATWKMTYPTKGSLYEYNGALYMDKMVGMPTSTSPSRTPPHTDWVKIATYS